jgi:hypothetical protein
MDRRSRKHDIGQRNINSECHLRDRLVHRRQYLVDGFGATVERCSVPRFELTMAGPYAVNCTSLLPGLILPLL